MHGHEGNRVHTGTDFLCLFLEVAATFSLMSVLLKIKYLILIQWKQGIESGLDVGNKSPASLAG